MILLAWLTTGCVQNAVVHFDNGKVCEIPASGSERCADLGPGNMAVFHTDDSGKVQLKTVPFNIKQQLPWLEKTGRVYAFEPGKLSGKLNGTTLQLVEKGADTTTISRINVPLKKVAFAGFSQESSDQPMYFIMVGDYPCDDQTNIDEKLANQDVYRLTRHGSCVAASGGLGVIVIESDIIDPSNRVNFLTMVPEMGGWIARTYPQVSTPMEVSQSWVYRINEAPLIEPKLMKPLAASSPGQPIPDWPSNCGSYEMALMEIGSINWGAPVCTFEQGVYQIRYCGQNNKLGFKKTGGEPVEMEIMPGCAVQFIKHDGLISVYLQSPDCADLNLDCTKKIQ
jgi:hypothetical protein